MVSSLSKRRGLRRSSYEKLAPLDKDLPHRSNHRSYVKRLAPLFVFAIVSWIIFETLLIPGVQYVNRRSSQEVLDSVESLVQRLEYQAAKATLEDAIENDPDNAVYKRAHKRLASQVYENWLLKNGADFSKVKLDADAPDGRGVFAAETIVPNETIVRIPQHLMITLELVKKSHVGQMIKKSGIPHSIHGLFAAFVASERNDPKSKWLPFLRALPQTFEYMPAQKSNATNTFLQGSHVVELMKKREKERMNECRLISNVFHTLTYDDILWGLFVSVNRAVAITTNSASTAVIVPFGNSLRHTSETPTTWGYLNSQKAFTIRSRMHFQAGEEIHHRFGDRSAGSFFVDYGFVPTKLSDKDEFSVSLEPTEEVDRQQYIGSWNRDFALTAMYDETWKRCLSFLRLREAMPDDWDQLIASNSKSLAFIGTISADNELKIWSAIEVAVNAKLAGYEKVAKLTDPKLLEVDEALAFSMMKLEMRMASRLLEAIVASKEAVSGGDVEDCERNRLCRLYWADIGGHKLLMEDQKPAISEREADKGLVENSDSFDRLHDWIESGSMPGNISGTVLRKYDMKDDNRGLHATRDFAPGQTVMRVPLAKILTSSLAKASEIGTEIRTLADAQGIELSAHTYMAAFIASEAKKSNSPWEAYISTLPASFGLPIYYSPSELAELQSSFTLDLIEKARKDQWEEYDQLKKAAPEVAKRLGREEFQRSIHAVCSRNFFVESGKDSMNILVPWVDMMNHNGYHAKTTWDFDFNTCEFLVTNARSISKGEPVYTTYGDKSNSQLLLNYGFVLEKNDHNVALFDFGSKKFFLKREISDLLMKKKFFYHLQNVHEYENPHFSTKEITISALRHLRDAASAGLGSFATTVDEDMELLKRSDSGELSISFRHRCAIIMRLGEKEVFEFWRDAAERTLSLLESGLVQTLTEALEHIQEL